MFDSCSECKNVFVNVRKTYKLILFLANLGKQDWGLSLCSNTHA